MSDTIFRCNAMRAALIFATNFFISAGHLTVAMAHETKNEISKRSTASPRARRGGPGEAPRGVGQKFVSVILRISILVLLGMPRAHASDERIFPRHNHNGTKVSYDQAEESIDSGRFTRQDIIDWKGQSSAGSLVQVDSNVVLKHPAIGGGSTSESQDVAVVFFDDQEQVIGSAIYKGSATKRGEFEIRDPGKIGLIKRTERFFSTIPNAHVLLKTDRHVFKLKPGDNKGFKITLIQNGIDNKTLNPSGWLGQQVFVGIPSVGLRGGTAHVIAVNHGMDAIEIKSDEIDLLNSDQPLYLGFNINFHDGTRMTVPPAEQLKQEGMIVIGDTGERTIRRVEIGEPYALVDRSSIRFQFGDAPNLFKEMFKPKNISSIELIRVRDDTTYTSNIIIDNIYPSTNRLRP